MRLRYFSWHPSLIAEMRRVTWTLAAHQLWQPVNRPLGWEITPLDMSPNPESVRPGACSPQPNQAREQRMARSVEWNVLCTENSFFLGEQSQTESLSFLGFQMNVRSRISWMSSFPLTSAFWVPIVVSVGLAWWLRPYQDDSSTMLSAYSYSEHTSSRRCFVRHINVQSA